MKERRGWKTSWGNMVRFKHNEIIRFHCFWGRSWPKSPPTCSHPLHTTGVRFFRCLCPSPFLKVVSLYSPLQGHIIAKKWARSSGWATRKARGLWENDYVIKNPAVKFESGDLPAWHLWVWPGGHGDLDKNVWTGVRRSQVTPTLFCLIFVLLYQLSFG